MKAKSAGISAAILAILLVLVIGLTALAYFGIGAERKLSYKDIKQGLDLKGGVYVVYEASKGVNPTDAEMKSAVALLQGRLDSKGWTEAEVSKEGSKRIRIEIPGVENAETAVSELGRTAQLSFLSEEFEVLVEGSLVKDAKAQIQQENGKAPEIVVALEFNDEGKRKFAEATANNIGKPIYILLDEEIISAPIVQTPITDGNAVINGTFTEEEANNLAGLIKSGSLPFDLDPIEMNNIGARLGVNSLRTSLLGGAVGLALVVIFLLIFYRVLGFAADWALAIYILIDFIVLALFNVTLTLPGVAGIILSIGMAVDANVIIFERIKEELNSGRTLRVSISNGFSRAFPAILDGNITTIIAGVVLFWLGTGPIKGFAQTLVIGIVISMFTALVITRLLINGLVGIGIKNPVLFGAKRKVDNDENSAK